MATTIPALRGKIGSTEYYLVTIPAGEVAEKLTVPKHLPDWEDMTIEERFQREINYNRVKKHIAPYLANDPDRFYGALIVDIYNDEGVSFEPLNKVGDFKFPTAYKNAGDAFGFLNLTGGEVLVPLDGQHRLAALNFAISGKDEKGNPIKDFDPNFEVSNDLVTLILVLHDKKKARKIFNKVNRYAKPTTKADNLITADDDIIAVITREEIANDLIGERLVNLSNTLSDTHHYFTTLSTLYDATTQILEMQIKKKIDSVNLPDKASQKVYRQEAQKIWDSILSEVDLFKLALSDTGESGDEKRIEIRKEFLLGKPIAQLSVVIAIMRVFTTPKKSGAKPSLKEVCKRINKLDWSNDNPLWQRVLMNGDRIVTGKQAARFASRFIAYLCGEPLADPEMKALRENYISMFPPEEQDKVKLPRRLVKP